MWLIHSSLHIFLHQISPVAKECPDLEVKVQPFKAGCVGVNTKADKFLCVPQHLCDCCHYGMVTES